MALDTIASCLNDLDVFRGLSPAQLERLAREADRIIRRDGQPLIEAGAMGDGALVIVSGRALALADPDRGFEAMTIRPGSMLGEAALLSEHHYNLTVIADGDVRAIKISRATLVENMRDDPSLAEHFQARVAARLSRVALELRVIDERLAAAADWSTQATG